MKKINYKFLDWYYEEIEVTEEFYELYSEICHREKLDNRRETRRHQSLNKLNEQGIDFVDNTSNTIEIVEHLELSENIHNALSTLTTKQYQVVVMHVFEEFSFRKIGELLSLSRYTVRDYYNNAIKKLKKFFSWYTPKTHISWLLSEGLLLYHILKE